MKFSKGGLMKKLFLIAILASVDAYAGMLGMLVHSELTFSVTGKQMYKCTYSIMGNYQTINMFDICPPTYEFE